MFEKQRFLEKYSLTGKELAGLGISWQTLNKIYDHYAGIRDSHLPTAKYVAGELSQTPHIHFVKYRLKDPDHLIEKIIRKKMEHPELQIDELNYSEIITDLIGVRAIHLFKRDWIYIHKFITSTWPLKSEPKAYVGCSTDEKIIREYSKNHCIVRTHPYGYQSIHYLVICQNKKAEQIVEIQMRTILEEAWSEIDHQIRYPYQSDDPLISEYLKIFNGLIEQLDQMGGVIRSLKNGKANGKLILNSPLGKKNRE
ncbi:MAG: GTP pyrophosphokinase [Calditrichaeota bacterium]|nr:GTP pyrophosphokinase [Calditrichota bacterium]